MKELREWAKAAGMRAVKTVAETAVSVIGTSHIIADVDWKIVTSASLLAGLLSMLVSIKGLPELEAAGKKEE